MEMLVIPKLIFLLALKSVIEKCVSVKQTFKLKKIIVVMVMVGMMIGSGFLMATASKNAPVQLVPQNFSALADAVSPAVVHIRVEKTVKVDGPALHQFGHHRRFLDFTKK